MRSVGQDLILNAKVQDHLVRSYFKVCFLNFMHHLIITIVRTAEPLNKMSLSSLKIERFQKKKRKDEKVFSSIGKEIKNKYKPTKLCASNIQKCFPEILKHVPSAGFEWGINLLGSTLYSTFNNEKCFTDGFRLFTKHKAVLRRMLINICIFLFLVE